MGKSKEFYIRAFSIYARTFDSYKDSPPKEIKEEGLKLIQSFVNDFGVLDTQEWGHSTYTNLLKVWFGSSAFLYIRKKPWIIPTQKTSTEFLNSLASLKTFEKLNKETAPINIKLMATEVLMKIKYARGDFDDWEEEKISDFRERPRHSKSPFKSKDEWRAYGIILKSEEEGL